MASGMDADLIAAVAAWERVRLGPRTAERVEAERKLIMLLQFRSGHPVVVGDYRYAYSVSEGWISRVPAAAIDRTYGMTRSRVRANNRSVGGADAC
jgi:hypothetical protein